MIAKVAAIEVPRSEWPELMQSLLANMGAGGRLPGQGAHVPAGGAGHRFYAIHNAPAGAGRSKRMPLHQRHVILAV